MKRVLISAAVAIWVSCLPRTAGAQVFGTLSPTIPPEEARAYGGAYFTVADNVLGFVGQARYPLSGSYEVGVQLGADRLQQREQLTGMSRTQHYTRTLVQLDGKAVLKRPDDDLPVALSADIAAGLVDSDAGDSVLFALGAAGSWLSAVTQDAGVEPYLAVVFLVDRSDSPGPEDGAETDTDLEVRLGAIYELLSSATVVAELQVGAGTWFAVGVNLGF